MKESWFKGCKTKAEKDERKRTLKAANLQFDLLSDQIKMRMKPEASRDYNKPNWAYEQISYNEYNQALKDVLDLINIKD